MISQIFECSSRVKTKRCILLLGNAGMGKTTLIRRLCLDWATGCLPQFDFVFLLDGKALNLKQPTFSLQTLLLNFSTFASPCLDLDAVYAQMAAAPERVLILFDGFDELRDYETLLQPQEKDLVTSMQRGGKAQTFTVKQLYSAILQRVLLPGSTLLLSARTRGTATQLLRRTDKFFEVCGFSPADLETYVTQYFADPVLRTSALECLEKCKFLRLLCWNPGLCRLVCQLLELSKNVDVPPQTLTELCNQLLHLKIKNGTDCIQHKETDPQTEGTPQAEESQAQTPGNSERKRSGRNAETTWVNTQRARRERKQQRHGVEVIGKERRSVSCEVQRIEEQALLSQLSHLAWDGVKANSSVLITERNVSPQLKTFGLGLGLIVSHDLRTPHAFSSGGCEAEQEDVDVNAKERERGSESEGPTNRAPDSPCDQMLLWSSPFLQSYLAAVHLTLSRFVSFLQSLFLFCVRFRESLQLHNHFFFQDYIRSSFSSQPSLPLKPQGSSTSSVGNP